MSRRLALKVHSISSLCQKQMKRVFVSSTKAPQFWYEPWGPKNARSSASQNLTGVSTAYIIDMSGGSSIETNVKRLYEIRSEPLATDNGDRTVRLGIAVRRVTV